MTAQPDDSGIDGDRLRYYWDWFNGIAVVLGAIAAVGSLLGVWLQAKIAQPSAQFEVLSTERVYPSTSVPGIDLSATYQGEPIQNRWKLRFRGINDGDQVIVGKGTKSTLLEESITLAFDSPAKVLGIDREEGSFPHQLQQTSE